MARLWVSGLAALVLSGGCTVHAQVRAQTESPIETIVITNETIRQYKHEKAKKSYEAGEVFYMAKMYDYAMDGFKEAIRDEYEYAPAHDKLAECYMLHGKYGLAKFHAREAIRIDPKPDYRATLGMIQQRENKDKRDEIERQIKAENII